MADYLQEMFDSCVDAAYSFLLTPEAYIERERDADLASNTPRAVDECGSKAGLLWSLVAATTSAFVATMNCFS